MRKSVDIAGNRRSRCGWYWKTKSIEYQKPSAGHADAGSTADLEVISQVVNVVLGLFCEATSRIKEKIGSQNRRQETTLRASR